MADSLTHFITADRFIKKGNYSKDFKKGLYFGVQGPDPFFFGKNINANAYADSLHDLAPKHYFEMESDIIEKSNDTYKGYYFGVLLHYFVDRIMHQYVGYLCRKYPSTSTHGRVEKEFDMVLYKKEYGKDIKTFKMNNYYVVDDNIVDNMYKFWNMRMPNEILTKEFVRQSLNTFISSTKMLINPNFIIVAMVKAKERKQNLNGELLCHIKNGYSEENMNYDKGEWESPIGKYTLSVEEIVQKGLVDFEKEYNIIVNANRNKEHYQFIHKEEFSCGK